MNRKLRSQGASQNSFYCSSLLVAFIGVMVIGVSGCKKPENSEAPEKQDSGVISSPVLSLPIERVIEGKDGRMLKVTIVKRTQTHISIIRAKDQKPFELEIINLSEADRNFVNSIPVSFVPDPFIANRQIAIRRLKTEAEGYYQDLSEGGLNGSQTSMLEGKIERLESEIQSIESQIRE